MLCGTSALSNSLKHACIIPPCISARCWQEHSTSDLLYVCILLNMWYTVMPGTRQPLASPRANAWQEARGSW